MLIEHKYDVFGIYTFGSPRPEDAAFEKELTGKVKGPHFRVANNVDIVPHVPPEPFYSHPGERKILDAISSSTSDNSWLEERFDAIRTFVSYVGKPLVITDYHKLNKSKKSYIPRLKDDLERNKSNYIN